MKKTKMILFVSVCLLSAPAFSMDTYETKTVRIVKNKSCKKQETPSIETATGWYSANDRVKIKYTQVREVGNFEGGTLYGYIGPAFRNNQQWQIALDKGFTKTAKGTNGVKYPNNNLLTLKIKGDERLYTTEVYKNKQGDSLAIFDRQARHDEIKKLANNNKFKIYECYSSNQKNNRPESFECGRRNKTQKLQKNH